MAEKISVNLQIENVSFGVGVMSRSCRNANNIEFTDLCRVKFTNLFKMCKMSTENRLKRAFQCFLLLCLSQVLLFYAVIQQRRNSEMAHFNLVYSLALTNCLFHNRRRIIEIIQFFSVCVRVCVFNVYRKCFFSNVIHKKNLFTRVSLLDYYAHCSHFVTSEKTHFFVYILFKIVKKFRIEEKKTSSQYLCSKKQTHTKLYGKL